MKQTHSKKIFHSPRNKSNLHFPPMKTEEGGGFAFAFGIRERTRGLKFSTRFRRAVAKLSLSAQVKELYWVEGRLAIGYSYSVISLVQIYDEKDVNEPLFLIIRKQEIKPAVFVNDKRRLRSHFMRKKNIVFIVF